MYFTVKLMLPPSELVAAALKGRSRHAQRNEDRAAMVAADKAAMQWAKGARPVESCGDWLIESRTTPGKVYRLWSERRGWGCACLAGRHGRPCWHAELMMAVEVAWEAANEEPGEPEPLPEPMPEPEPIEVEDDWY